jgi:hypothetical protein
MATAEITRDVSVGTTKAVTPLTGNAVQGSTQEYGVTGSSQFYPTPVFFAPQDNREELNAQWETLLPARVFYAVPLVNVSDPLQHNYVQWDRLNLELMRIASLTANWDGEGAEAISRAAVDNAQTLLQLAKNVAGRSTFFQCPLPLLVASIDGGVILKWVCGSKELKCKILDNVIEVIRWKSPDHFESDGFWEVPVDHVSEHLEWLFR